MTREEEGERNTPERKRQEANGLGISVAVRSGMRGKPNAPCPVSRGLKPGKALNLLKQRLLKFPRQEQHKVQKSLPLF